MMADKDEMRQQIAEKLDKRDEERLEEIQRRKEVKDTQVAANENVDLIKEKFASAERRLIKSLENADTVDKSSLSDYFENVFSNFQALQKFLTDSAIVLPSYDTQRFQATLAKLQVTIQEKKLAAVPKKKFAFKSKTKTTEKSATVETKSDLADGVKTALMSDINYSHADLTDQTVVMKEDEVHDKDIAMARLSNCVVKLYGSPRALRFDAMKMCKVFCGPVAGSIFIDNCKDCTFIVACQQLRVHHTTATHFYLHVTSRGIIEDSNTVSFAPYNWSYPELDDHYNIAKLDKSRNTWNDIDDFNWLASDTPSPNWTVLPESERKNSWET